MPRKPSIALTDKRTPAERVATARRAGIKGGRARRPGRGKSPWAEREYDDAEAEFLRAAEQFRSKNRKPFMTATDYLAVLLSLGYRKGAPDE